MEWSEMEMEWNSVHFLARTVLYYVSATESAEA